MIKYKAASEQLFLFRNKCAIDIRDNILIPSAGSNPLILPLIKGCCFYNAADQLKQKMYQLIYKGDIGNKYS